MKRKLENGTETLPCSSTLGTGLVACPICQKQVPSATINVHLDTTCTLSPAEDSLRSGPKRGKTESARQGIAPKLSKYFSTAQPQAQLISPEAKDAEPFQNRNAVCEDQAAVQSRPSDPEGPGIRNASDGPTGENEESASAADRVQPEQLPEQNSASSCAQPAVSAGRNLALLMQSAAKKKLPGQFLFEDFVTEKEERELVAFIDSCEPPWHLSTFNGPHKGKAWGVRMDLQRRTVLEPKYPMPAFLTGLADRMRKMQPLVSFHPSEANANDYYPDQGMYLGPHVDDRQLSTGAIVTLSLVSSAVMSFQRDKQPNSPKIRILLPQRSLQVLTRESRYSFTHAIDPKDFHAERRLSVTFRQSPLRRN